MTEVEKLRKQLWEYITGSAVLGIIAIGLLIAYMHAENDNRRIYNTLQERCESPAFFDRESLSCVIVYQVP